MRDSYNNKKRCYAKATICKDLLPWGSRGVPTFPYWALDISHDKTVLVIQKFHTYLCNLQASQHVCHHVYILMAICIERSR